MERAKPRDLIYCDPPYSNTQAILYGAQSFDLKNLFRVIERCVRRGVYVALSIDGTKKSGQKTIEYHPKGFVQTGTADRLRTVDAKAVPDGWQNSQGEVVKDRLLLTY